MPDQPQERPWRPVVGSAAFFLAAPGIVAGVVPYAVTRWHAEGAYLGPILGVVVGSLLVLSGLVCLIDCFARFALEGRGTPAPVAPTRRLIVSGAYRHVRNPMYVSVVSLIIGQAVLFGSPTLLGYAAVVWALFHAFVRVYEEPTLRSQYGDAYDNYSAHVARWWPRWRPWRQTGPQA